MPARTEALLATLLALAPCVAAAQTPAWPTAQDIDRALQANPVPDNARINAQSPAAVPKVDTRTTPLDIEALAKAKRSLATRPTKSAALRIFVTLAMPRPSLELLTEHAARTGAVLVLRGLQSQSMRETLRTVTELIGARTVAWVIDPEAFTRYGVVHAPAFVLDLRDAPAPDTQRCTDHCPGPDAFVSVAGDVSLDYALEAMVRHRPQAATVVEPMLKRLRGS